MTYWYSLTLGHLSTLIRGSLSCRIWQSRQRPTTGQCSEEETKEYSILNKISISQPWPQDSGIITRELIKKKHCFLYTTWKPQNKVITILINHMCETLYKLCPENPDMCSRCGTQNSTPINPNQYYQLKAAWRWGVCFLEGNDRFLTTVQGQSHN